MYRKSISTAVIAAMLGLGGAAMAGDQQAPETGSSAMPQESQTQRAPETMAPTPVTPEQDRPAAQEQPAAPEQPTAQTEDEAAGDQAAALSDRLLGQPVLTKNGKEIGQVVGIQTDNGRVSALDIEHGGFLGFGKKQARVAADTVSLSDQGVVLHMTQDQLAEMPEPEPKTEAEPAQ